MQSIRQLFSRPLESNIPSPSSLEMGLPGYSTLTLGPAPTISELDLFERKALTLRELETRVSTLRPARASDKFVTRPSGADEIAKQRFLREASEKSAEMNVDRSTHEIGCTLEWTRVQEGPLAPSWIDVLRPPVITREMVRSSMVSEARERVLVAQEFGSAIGMLVGLPVLVQSVVMGEILSKVKESFVAGLFPALVGLPTVLGAMFIGSRIAKNRVEKNGIVATNLSNNSFFAASICDKNTSRELRSWLKTHDYLDASHGLSSGKNYSFLISELQHAGYSADLATNVVQYLKLAQEFASIDLNSETA